jgi:hypothetical protein
MLFIQLGIGQMARQLPLEQKIPGSSPGSPAKTKRHFV